MRVRPAEHIQRFYVPVIEAPLNSFFRFPAFSRQLAGLIGAESDMADLFLDDFRQTALERQIAAIEEFFQLIPTDPIDEKTEDSEVFPRFDDSTKSL